MKPILVIGQHGQVSTYLQRALASSQYSLQVAGRELLDLSQTDKIQAALEKINPGIIVNPAAYTAVDLAEEEAQLADSINHLAVAQIAAYASQTATPLIHFSTDYVFDGQADRAYTEEDTPAPTGVYGASKLAGEQAVLASGAAALILRTSWVYSTHGNNFYKTMLALAQTRDELSVVADQIGSPTYAGSIAEATRQLLDIIIRQREISAEQSGVYHFSCAGQASWCDFAKAIFAENGIAEMTVNPISTADYPTAAQRPAFSVLDNQKLAKQFGIRLPDWQSALKQCASD